MNPGKLTKNKDTDCSKEFWAAVERASAAVATWASWKQPRVGKKQ